MTGAGLSTPQGDQHLGTTTVLFTDLVDSTSYLSENGEEAADDARRRHLAVARSAADAHEGRFVKNLGDGAMLVFSSAVAAVDAAVAIQEATTAEDPAVRVGVSAGDVIVEDDDFFGTPVVIASRLCSRARAGQVLVARLVVDLAGSRVGHTFHLVGSLALKGIADPVAACEVRVGDQPALGVEPVDSERERSSAPLPGPLRAATGEFVGREGEIERMLDAARVADTGVPQLVLLEGEAGMGKTRLAAEAARRMHADGAHVLLGRCERDDPYGPFKQVVEAVAEASGDDTMRAMLRRVGADVLHLSPRLKERFSDLAPPKDAGDRFRLFDSFRSWLAEIASDQVVVIVLDDFHDADPGSLALARHLGRSSMSARLVLMATVRSDLVDPALTELLTDLERLEIASTIALGAMTDDDVASLAAHWAGQPIEAALCHRLASDTGGNPLFVREMLRTLGEQGLFEHPRRMAELLEHTELPKSVRGIVSHRLDGLSEHARSVLTGSAVLGAQFSTRLLRTMVALPDDLVLVGIEEAVACGLLSEAAGAPGHLRFDHDVARRAIYEETPLGDRVLLHQRAAESLEQMADAGESVSAADIAQHYVAASPLADPERTASMCEQAGDVAIDGLAYENAATRFRQALEALQTPPVEKTVELLHKEGVALWAANRVEDARRVLSKAADIAEAADLPVDLARIAVAHQGEALGGLFMIIGEHDDQALDLIDRALAAMGKDDSPDRALLLASRAIGLAWSAADEERAALASEAEEIAHRVADSATLARVLARTTMARHGLDTPASQITRFEEVETLAVDNGLDAVRACCIIGRVVSTYENGDVEAALALFAQNEATLTTSRDPYSRHWVRWMNGTLKSLRGDLDGGEAGAEAAFAETIGDISDRPTSGIVAMYASAITMTRIHQGRVGEYGAVLRELGDVSPNMPIFRLGEAMAAIDNGDEARARVLLHAVDLQAIPRNGAWASTMLAAVQVAWHLDDRTTLGPLWAMLAPVADRCDSIFLFFSFGSLARSVAMLASMRGDHDQALELLAQARDVHERLESVPMVLFGDALTAEVLLRRGRPEDREVARALLDATYDAADAAGLRYTCAEINRTRANHLVDEGPTRRLDDMRRGAIDSVRGSILRGKGAVTSRVQAGISRFVSDRTDAEIETRFASDARIGALIRSVALAFRADRAAGFEGVIVFSLTYATQGLQTSGAIDWTIRVQGSRARPGRGRAPDPTLVVNLTVADFVRFVAGELNTVSALIDGRVRVDGSLELGGRLPEMFGTAS